MPSLSSLLLLAISATAIVLPPKSPSAAKINTDIESIDDSISQLTDSIQTFNGAAIIPDMRKLSDLVSTSTADVKTSDAIDDQSAGFVVSTLQDEFQPAVEDMLDALGTAKAKVKKAELEKSVLGWLQNLGTWRRTLFLHQSRKCRRIEGMRCEKC